MSAAESPTAHALDHRVPPPIVALILAVIMWGLARVGPTVALPSTMRLSLSLAFACAAVVFGFFAFGAFRRASTTIDPINIDRASTLVTSGVFRVTRNPMYVALSAVLISWSIFLAAVATIVGPVAFVLYIIRFQIVPEERVMRSKFGAAYEDYVARTRRWL